ncbi:MFS transporter [Thioclava sp. SK-1]|uniref:MFS transporter n=1 Tax=Thioclava sp. SK-1 TaxID=1889770 RepID=UPI000824A54A|nr:MFS transporter [Thioclava sp. SK-1]OCX65754.1 MFS transporter [Thioclava sp. SK-1]
MSDDTHRSAYIGLLCANTLLSSVMPMLIILGGLAGLMLAPSPAFATFPPSVQTLAGLLVTGPFSLLMGRYGRRVGFICGAGLAIFGGALAVAAFYTSSFVLLCIAHMGFGAALACYQYFRFAAAETVPPSWQPVAISIMLTSGLVAALIGPQIFIWTKDALAPLPLAGAYAAIGLISLLGILPLGLLRLPRPTAPARAKTDHSSLRSPKVRTAITLGAASQGIMVLLMAPTPLAMLSCGLTEAQAGDVIRWHVVAMFAPSFLTGIIIRKFGALRIACTGLCLLILAASIAASGMQLDIFYASLIILGVGWNFGFIGATSLLAQAVPVEDRASVQGINDTILALAATLCAFGSGILVTGPGWSAVALTAIPIVLAALAVATWGKRQLMTS